MSDAILDQVDANASPSLRLVGEPEVYSLSVDGDFTIGRGSENELVLDDSAVSRNHARVYWQNDGYVVIDGESANGTFVERGQKLLPASEPLPLRHGDVLRFGPFRLLFEDGSGTRMDPERAQPWGAEIHLPTVAAGFSLFFAGFFIWALPIYLFREIGVQEKLWGVPVLGLPVLVGAGARFVAGLMTDARGPYLPGMLLLGTGTAALAVLAAFGDQEFVVYPAIAVLGVGLAAPPICLPLVSRRTAPNRRGFAMAAVSAGSIGFAFAVFAIPMLNIPMLSWQGVLGLALVPVAIAFAVFAYGARGSWTPAPRGEWRSLALSPRMRTVGLLFGITFGSVAALYSFLPGELDKATFNFSGEWPFLVVAFGALAGAAMGVVIGLLVDRIGPIRLLAYPLAIGAVLLAIVASLADNQVAAGIVFVAMLSLFDGGKSAVFKLGAQKFGETPGAGIGIITAAGALLGFALFLLLRATAEMERWEPWLPFALLAAPAAAAAAWLYVSSLLEPDAGLGPALPATPHLQRLDSFGLPTTATEVGQRLDIGRAQGNRLLLREDDLVSRRHAQIEIVGSRVLIRDLRSTNGTMLWRARSWQPIEEEELHDGDVIVIGANVFRFSTGAVAREE